jgi:hypothetical protein
MPRKIGDIHYDLRKYLIAKGVKFLTPNTFHCFNPSCKSNGWSGMITSGRIFICFSCGMRGDLYDAIEFFEGIKDREKKFEFAKFFFRGGQKCLN